MSMRKSISIAGIVLLIAVVTGAEEPAPKADPLAPVQVLEGVWQGEGKGFGQTSSVTHEWETVLDGKFMRLTTLSVTKDDNGAESVHRDVGYISWSESEHVLRFRQFLSEGFVNTFRVEENDGPSSGFNFEPESTEGAENLVARMTLRFDQEGGYEMILELGGKGKPLKACQTMKLKKVS